MSKGKSLAGQFKPFSEKQLAALTWWCPDSPYKDYNGIIADGSIRAGKTVAMAISFILWAMDAFALPSRFEGLCIVAVEAQAAGLPLLCSEGVTKEAGITALARWEPLDPELWAKVLAGTPDAERQSGADSVREAGFDVARVGKSIEEAYRCI